MRPSIMTIALALCIVWMTTPGCSGSPEGAPAAREAAAARPQNACDLIDRAELEAIAAQKLDRVHEIQADNQSVCELNPTGADRTLVYITVHWQGGKARAGVIQAANSMAKDLLNDKDVDIMELTGSETVKGLADKAFYSDLMPSWVLKGDVMVEVLSPAFDRAKTRAMFLAVARKALSRLP